MIVKREKETLVFIVSFALIEKDHSEYLLSRSIPLGGETKPDQRMNIKGVYETTK